MAIPQELKDLKLWTPCYHASSGQSPKRPMIAPTHYEQALTYQDLQAQLKENQLYGILVSPHNDYIIVDIDQPTIPEHIVQFLNKYPTYVEYSPSGVKAHVIYKTDKSVFTKAQLKNTNLFDGEIFVKDQFITVTGNCHPLSTKDHTITRIPVKVFSDCFLGSGSEKVIDIATKQPLASAHLPIPINYTMTHVQHWLSVIPAVPNDRIQRAYSQMGASVNAYDHWTIIAFALRDAAERLDAYYTGAQLFDEWSAKDAEKYKGTEETYAKFANCPPDPANGITVKTLQKLFRSCHLIWPEPRTDKDGNPLPIPIDTSMTNYMELFNFFNLKVKRNQITKNIAIEGDEEVITKYFSTAMKPAYGSRSQDLRASELEACLIGFCQAYGFKTIGMQIVRTVAQFWTENCLIEFNPIKDWITSKPWDGSPRLPHLLDTIKFGLEVEAKDVFLFKELIKKNLMGVIRNNFYKGNYGGTSGIVIFQGLENTRKSTWIKNLLPYDLRFHYVGESQIFIQGSSSIKELQLEAGMFQIVLFDEVERLLQGKNSSILKNLLTQEMDTYRPLYGKTPEKTKRMAIFFGTTNEVLLQMANTGNRRIAVIPIEFCDTASQEEIDMQQVFAELQYQFENAKVKESLWQLSELEIKHVNALNEDYKSESSLDTVIKDMFDFSHQFNIDEFRGPSRGIQRDAHPRIFNTVSLTATVNIEHKLNVSHAAVTQVLHRLLGQWTGTSFKKKVLPNVKGYILNGQFIQGPTQKRWLMPPRRTNFPQ